ncbi:MAG: putative bifunctional diguanylate cyclase/phosphodiesterase [Methylomonas sp.]
MNSRPNHSGVTNNFWLALLILFVLAGAFFIYVYTEKQIDRANERRQLSYFLADQLRQSSDDLTRMIRTYVVTGDSRYKKYFQDIIDIRNGKIARPEGYFNAYWDLVIASKLPPPAETGPGIPFLDLARQAGFTDEELGKLTEAKTYSDALVNLELDAMKVVESTGPEATIEREKARQSLYDDNYHLAKAKIMISINEIYRLVDERTLAAVHDAQYTALVFRWIFIAGCLGAIFQLWRSYKALNTTLGCTASEIQAHMRRIAEGDLTTVITVPPDLENSVLAGLYDMQKTMYAHELDRKKIEADLRIAAAAFETHEAIMITDAQANILRVNKAFENITGFPANEVIGKNPRILSSGLHDKRFYQTMWHQLINIGIWEGEVWDRRKSGEIYPKWLTITALKNSTGEPTEYVAIFTDITERKQAEEEIRNLACYDPLTKLPNRRLLLDRLELALAASARNHRYGALLFLDMDKFKSLNDTMGHNIGDLMLIEVAERIKFSVREVDTVTRFGGDEFVVVFEDLGETADEASQRMSVIAEKIRTALSVPFHLKQHVHISSPSIGVSVFYGHTTSADDLIKHADIAMYQAKNAGRNRVQFFDPVLQKSVETRISLESDLRHALPQHQLQLYYQAQYDNSGMAFGAEALIRWIHPERGMVSPAQFIPIAEESTLIQEIGLWVLETACQQLALWSKNEATRHLLLAINVSAHQFMLPRFVESVETTVRAHGIDPSCLKLELTESVILSDIEDVIYKIQQLNTFGVRLSLDDFGTGYSSLSYLKRLPIHQIKIDQSFVRDIVSDPNDAVMVKNIIDIANNFNLNVIAEGVETEEQLEFLKQYGCTAFQGYLFGKPMPIEQFEEQLMRKMQ